MSVQLDCKDRLQRVAALLTVSFDGVMAEHRCAPCETHLHQLAPLILIVVRRPVEQSHLRSIPDLERDQEFLMASAYIPPQSHHL